MPTSWPARDVVVCHFDVPSQLYTVSTDEQTYLLDEAADFLQFGDAVGQEIRLCAFADLIYSEHSAHHPTLILRYRSHEQHYDPEQRTIARVQRDLSVRARVCSALRACWVRKLRFLR